ncbi:uncharacterized protein LOC114949057 [Acropora millepora]|uniref:uncharacterized protein LOC114949057 n=1 Tax=Acropora millepora TaxID=45264 RepID=UPI001CF2EA0D|nr:uncharacterized protein LOC114949057 [Acropora millepora]
MAKRAGVRYEDDVDCILTNPSSSAASNHQKDHIKVLSWEPEVVGDIVEDLSIFGFPEKEREKEGWGRLEEVAFWSKKVSYATKNKIRLPPFMTHTLDEMLWQAREQFAVCLLILFSISNTSNDFVDLFFKIINNQLKKLRGKFSFGSLMPT